MRILLVCAGNTCRSPMAGGLLKAMARERGLAIEVRTAGTSPPVCGCVRPEAVTAMAEVGIDITDEYPKPASAELLAWADMVVPLYDRAREYLCDEGPSVEAKIMCLASEVLDPVGCPIETYRERRDQLADLLSQFVDHLTRQ